MRKSIFGVILTAALAGCAVNQSQLATQYATLKLLEGEHVTQAAVLSRVERVRNLLDGEVASEDAILAAIGWENLPPSDRLLVSAILADVTLSTGEIESERAREALDWIEQAARMHE